MCRKWFQQNNRNAIVVLCNGRRTWRRWWGRGGRSRLGANGARWRATVATLAGTTARGATRAVLMLSRVIAVCRRVGVIDVVATSREEAGAPFSEWPTIRPQAGHR